MSKAQLRQLMDGTRPSRQRLMDYVAGDSNAYLRPLNIYRPVDTAGGIDIEQTAMFDHGLFQHDLHVTTYTCQQALLLLKPHVAVPSDSEAT